MTRRALSIAFMLSLVAPALAQTPKPVTIECTTDRKTVSVAETNPNAAEAICEYACYYTAADKQQHHTSTSSGIVRPGKNTSGMGRVDGEPPYTAISTKGSCISWKCQTNSKGQLVCSAN
jgi:hypothetical protein